MCGIKINAQGLIINAFTMFKGEFYETCQEYAWLSLLKKHFKDKGCLTLKVILTSINQTN